MNARQISGRTDRRRSWLRGVAVATSIAAVAGSMYAIGSPSPANGAIPSYPAATGFLHSRFLIGTWEQPISSPQHAGNFAYWKSLGINTLVELPQESQYTNATYAQQWDTAACAAGLSEMRRPIGDDPATDSGNRSSCMIAWNLPDEPDLGEPSTSSAATCGSTVPGVSMTPAQISTLYQRDKAANPSRPVYLSLVGNLLMSSNCLPIDMKYGRFADWISADDYPIDAGRANPMNIITREMTGLAHVGTAGAGRFTFIETGHIGNRRAPITPAQLRGEIWMAVINGARGIIYFSDTAPAQGLGTPSTFDNTTAGIPSMMKSQNAILSGLQGLLQGVVNPAGMGISVPSPLQAGWRANSTGRYFIVVNTSAYTKRLSMRFVGAGGNKNASVIGERRYVWVNGTGYGTDTFAPYAVHIYRL